MANQVLSQEEKNALSDAMKVSEETLSATQGLDHIINTFEAAGSAFDNLHEAVVVTDTLGEIVWYTEELGDILGYTPSRNNFIGQRLFDSLFEAAEQKQKLLEKVIQSGEPKTSTRVEYYLPGETRYFDLKISPLREDISGAIVGAKVGIIDNTKLYNLSYKDPLTGVYNRRFLKDALTREKRAYPRRKFEDCKGLGVIMLDLDYFKRYNGTYGHEQGDNALKQSAKVLNSACYRPGDIVIRWGGEEFVALLPDTDIAGTEEVADRAKTKLSEARVPLHPSNNSPNKNYWPDKQNPREYKTISGTIGITAFPQPTKDIDRLIGDADQALYLGKEIQRGSIKIFAT